MATRLERHAEVTERLTARTDDEIISLLDSCDWRPGWGLNGRIDVDGHDVFVKTLPLTDIEHADLSSTRNFFDLAMHYHYGVGSAGFGSAREVTVHRRVSDWVVAGITEHFPLLHHHRVLPLPSQTRTWDDDRRNAYLARWGDDPSIEDFIDRRERSTHAIATFAEYIPHVLMDWLPTHQSAIGSVIDQGLDTLALLRDRGIAHLDSNPSNIVTDGHRVFFTDFGLALDGSFDLAEDERAFLAGHRHFDVGEFLASLTWQPPGGHVEFEADYLDTLLPYRQIVDEMSAVFARLAADPTAPSGYDDGLVARLLGQVD